MSSFQTIGRIKGIHSYAAAQARYETTKPIRGSDNLRPLGDRRDAARYYIRQEGVGEYCAYLYNTPVVTFYPDNTIHIRTYGHDTALSIDFIGQVLGIQASRTRGQCVFTIDGTKYVTSGRDGKLVLQNDNGKLSVAERQTHKQYVVSRTGANNVRRRYSEFRAYLKGFLKLRTQEYTFRAPYHGVSAEVRDLVEVDVKELVEIMGTVKHDDGWSNNPQRNDYVDASIVHQITWINSPNYERNNTGLDVMIQNGQPDETKTASFYAACMRLVVAVTMGQQTRAIPVDREYVRVAPSDVLTMLDEIQFKWFSDEVFVVAEVPEGKVPNHKYNDWIRPRQI